MGGRGNPWIPPPMFRMRPPHPGMLPPPPREGMGPPHNNNNMWGSQRPSTPRFHHSRGPPRGRAMPRGRGRGPPGFRHHTPPFMSNFGGGKRPNPDGQDQNKKLKMTDSGKSDGGEYLCETCDRSFHSSEAFAKHNAQHQTCGLEGCTFTAHPKIIQKHVEVQHLSGLFKRIGKMDSPEDIARWIADRKRNYPTKENIEKKQAQREERINRGERLFPDTSLYNTDWSSRRGGGRGGRGRGRGRGRGGHEFNQRGCGRGRGRGTFNPHKRGTSFTYTVKDDDDDDEEAGDSKRRLPRFPGTGIFKEKNEEDCLHNSRSAKEDYSDSEWEGSAPTSVSNSSVPRACDALNSLMAVYGSDSDDGPQEISILRSEESFVNKNLETSRVIRNDALSISPDNVKCLENENISRSKEDFPENTDSSMAEMSSTDLQDQAESLVDVHLVSGEASDNCNNKKNIKSEMEQTEANEAVSEVNDFNNESSGVLDCPESGRNMDNVIQDVEECQDTSGILDCETSHSLESVPGPVNEIHISSNDSLRENVGPNKKLSHSDEPSQKNQKEPKIEKPTPVKSKHFPYMRVKRKTLLEKLLAKEIIHERNVLLQCVKHVVDGNFFGLGDQPKERIPASEHLKSATKNDLAVIQCVQYIVKRNFFESSSGE